MKYIKLFEELNKEDVAIADGKGADLGEINQVEIPVPPGFVVTATTRDKFIKKTVHKGKLNENEKKVRNSNIHNNASKSTESPVHGDNEEYIPSVNTNLTDDNRILIVGIVILGFLAVLGLLLARVMLQWQW